MISVDEKPPRHTRDPEATRRGILDAALNEFAEHGLSGARVDAIAARTNTTVRMIYYYFTSKEGLYVAVLEERYAAVRRAEAELQVDQLDPAAAICRLVEFIFDYHAADPRFARLVSIENIHHAAYISRSASMQTTNASAIDTLADVLRRGQATGQFRSDATPIGLHLLITSFCFFRVANRHTLRSIFAQDPLAPELHGTHRRMAVDAVIGFLMMGDARPGASHGV